MVVFKFNFNRASQGLALFLLSLFSFSQNNNELFPAFKKYKTWGYHVAPIVYNRASVNLKQGTQTISPLPMTSMRFGLTKLIKPQNKISFKTGFYIEVTPLYRYEFKVIKEDLFGRFDEDYEEFNGAAFYRPVLTIPALVQFKKQLENKIYFNLETGFQFLIMQQGDFSTGLLLSDYDIDETREIFGLYGSNSETSIYPNLVISPGLYITLDKLLIQANFIYQKSLVAYYKGEYLFDNLTVSPRSRGDYKLQGDFIGLSFNVHILKKENRASWKRKNQNKDEFDEEN